MKNDFTHRLIKGKIAEIIFELMFRETKEFTVFHFGYESTLPMIAQIRGVIDHTTETVDRVIEQVKRNPDFLVIKKDNEEAYFVEVKYRADLDRSKILKITEDISKRWESSYLFIICDRHFYFDSIEEIKRKEGGISLLSENIVSKEVQDKYKDVIYDFLPNSRIE